MPNNQQIHVKYAAFETPLSRCHQTYLHGQGFGLDQKTWADTTESYSNTTDRDSPSVNLPRVEATQDPIFLALPGPCLVFQNHIPRIRLLMPTHLGIPLRRHCQVCPLRCISNITGLPKSPGKIRFESIRSLATSTWLCQLRISTPPCAPLMTFLSRWWGLTWAILFK